MLPSVIFLLAMSIIVASPEVLAQVKRYTVKGAYAALVNSPELMNMARNNCIIWRQRNKEGRSYYQDTSGFMTVIAAGDSPSAAMAVSAAVGLWTQKNCPDIW